MSDERFDRLDEGLGEVRQGLGEVRQGLGEVRQELGEVRQQVDDLGRQMRVLHEDALDRIAAVAESVGAMDAKMDRRFAELTETIGRRLDPLALVVRQHSVDIAQLKQGRS